MYTKVKQTCSKLSLYILVSAMFGLAVWFNIYAVESIDQDLAALTDSPSAINVSDSFSEMFVRKANNIEVEIEKANNTEIEIEKTNDSNNQMQEVVSEEVIEYELSTVEVESYTIKEYNKLSGPELYLSYVDQIITEIYPDIPADYVKAIIWRESTYNPKCKTGDNVGLMQVSLKWDMDRARSLGVDDLYDPYGNILVGCDILNEFTKTYSFEYAINYHAGGYVYANAYRNSISPVEKQLARIIEQMNNGDIQIGGE